MARLNIDFANPTDEDLAYLAQRTWLVSDAELQGHTGIRGAVAAYAAGERTAAAEEQEEVISYAQGTVEELRAELERRGLDTKGKKAELITRLELDDVETEKTEEDNDGEEPGAGDEEVPEED